MLKKYALVIMCVCVLFSSPVTAEEFFDAVVEKVIDGDSVILRGGTLVDYMGVSAISSRGGSMANSKIAQYATEYNKSLVENKKVRLELVDPASAPDRSSKRYAYIFVGGRMVNTVLLKKGLAVISRTFPPGSKYQRYFYQMQQEALAGRQGIWSLLTPENLAAVEKKNYAFQ